MKKILLGLLVLLSLVGGGVYYLFSNIDSIVKTAIEEFGSQATQTSVSLNNVKISLKNGSGALSGLSVENPDGFKTPNAFYLDSISLEIDPKSIMGKGAIIIKKIAITNPKITYEVALNGDTNLKAIEKNAKTYASEMKVQAKADEQEKPSAEPSRKIIIKSFTLSDGEIEISHEMLKGKALQAKLPTIQLNNIGQDDNGATPEQVASLLMGVLSSRAAEIASADLTKNLLPIDDIKKEAVEQIGGKLLNMFGK